jgi:hypothetical protein
MGEYGTCTQRNTCIMAPPPSSPSYDEAGWWFNTFRFYQDNQCLTHTTPAPPGAPAGSDPTYMGGPLGWAYWTANGIYGDSWNWNAGANTWQTCYGQRESYGVLGGDMATPSAQLLLQSLFVGPSADPEATLATAPAPSGPWPSYACTPYSG